MSTLEVAIFLIGMVIVALVGVIVIERRPVTPARRPQRRHAKGLDPRPIVVSRTARTQN